MRRRLCYFFPPNTVHTLFETTRCPPPPPLLTLKTLFLTHFFLASVPERVPLFLCVPLSPVSAVFPPITLHPTPTPAPLPASPPPPPCQRRCPPTVSCFFALRLRPLRLSGARGGVPKRARVSSTPQVSTHNTAAAFFIKPTRHTAGLFRPLGVGLFFRCAFCFVLFFHRARGGQKTEPVCAGPSSFLLVRLPPPPPHTPRFRLLRVFSSGHRSRIRKNNGLGFLGFSHRFSFVSLAAVKSHTHIFCTLSLPSKKNHPHSHHTILSQSDCWRE